MKRIILIFFGPPFSGKGTVSSFVSKKMKLPIVSTGELLREEEAKPTALGREIASLIDQGRMVPDRITETLLSQHLKKAEFKKGFVLDGFPRRGAQQHYLLKNILKKNDRILVVKIELADKEVMKRFGGRLTCACGATYHIKSNPPKKKGICDVCGQKLYVRKDDKKSVMMRRLKYYHKHIKPMLETWEKSGEMLKVDGRKKIEEERREVLIKIKDYFNK